MTLDSVKQSPTAPAPRRGSYFEQRMDEIRDNPALVKKDARPDRKTAPVTQEVGYIYFVRMGTCVKIGYTLDVAGRMKTIQTSCPEKIHLMRIERGPHLPLGKHGASQGQRGV